MVTVRYHGYCPLLWLLGITMVTIQPISIACYLRIQPRYCLPLIFSCFKALTDIGKYSVGRLRPNFIHACSPNVSLTSCTAGHYITNFSCQRSSQSIIDLARTSFPSGHASQSAYSMVFLVVSDKFCLFAWISYNY